MMRPNPFKAYGKQCLCKPLIHSETYNICANLSKTPRETTPGAGRRGLHYPLPRMPQGHGKHPHKFLTNSHKVTSPPVGPEIKKKRRFSRPRLHKLRKILPESIVGLPLVKTCTCSRLLLNWIGLLSPEKLSSHSAAG